MTNQQRLLQVNLGAQHPSEHLGLLRTGWTKDKGFWLQNSWVFFKQRFGYLLLTIPPIQPNGATGVSISSSGVVNTAPNHTGTLLTVGALALATYACARFITWYVPKTLGLLRDIVHGSNNLDSDSEDDDSDHEESESEDEGHLPASRYRKQYFEGRKEGRYTVEPFPEEGKPRSYRR